MERTEVAPADRWNVEALYPSLEEWKKDFSQWQGDFGISSFKGRLHEGPEMIEALLKKYLETEKSLSRLYTYAHLRHDEDVASDAHKQAYLLITARFHEFTQEAAWIDPEFLQIPQEKLDRYLASANLQPYRIYLEKILYLKPHVLSAKEEELLATAGQALETSERAFGAFNNADLKFSSVADSKGDLHELTHGKYLLYLRSPDRTLRQNAYQTLHKSFFAYENTLCELISGQIQRHLFNKKTRKFSSCLEAALYPHKIDPQVYISLIETVRKGLPALHKYLELRKKALGVGELHMWDLHVPLVRDVDLSMKYPEAEKLVIESVELLGKEYQKDLFKGLLQDRWVDRYENARKRSGAYSSGCYGSMPYILMNYHGNFHDVMTLAHEAGHSMHSLLSWRTQQYQDSHYPIFVAEVASTLNEELLLRRLISKTTEREKRAFLINQRIEDIRNTFFRQTMFAEFELKLHQLAEQGLPLTPALLKKEYRDLNLAYFGSAVTVDPEVDIEWARIPHFYYNFYVYQYATGISAAHALVGILEKEGAKNYLKFLSSGGSKYPLELLSLAGVDMRKGEAVQSTIDHFKELTQELGSLLALPESFSDPGRIPA